MNKTEVRELIQDLKPKQAKCNQEIESIIYKLEATQINPTMRNTPQPDSEPMALQSEIKQGS